MQKIRLLVVLAIVSLTLQIACAQKASNPIAVNDYPTFKDGNEGLWRFFSKKMHRPATESRGTVVISALIEADGTITRTSVQTSVDPLLDKEALRLVRLTSKMWIPGRFRKERKVSVKFIDK